MGPRNGVSFVTFKSISIACSTQKEISMSDERQTQEPYRAIEPSAHEKAERRPNHWVRALIAFAIGAAAITALQVTANDADHQNANMASMGIVLLTAIAVIYQLQRGFARLGHRFVVPAVVGLGLLGFFTVFELDGVSGEIMPQFRNRFQERLARKTVNPNSSPSTDGLVTPATGDSADRYSLHQRRVARFLGKRSD